MGSRSYALTLAAVLMTVGCTSALAPENEGISSVAQQNGGDQDAAPQSPATPAGPASPAGPANPSGPTTPAGDDGAEGDVLGLVSDEDTDLTEFEGKSTYALSMKDNGLMTLMVTDVEARDTMFRKVKAYECKPCQGSADEHCATGGGTAAKSVTITFMKSFTGSATHKVDAQGFPKEDANALTSDATANMNAGMTLSNSLNPMASPNTGTVDFTAGKRPAKAGDEYEATVDLTFGDGLKYSGKLTGKVYELPTNPTPPTCAEGEYLAATYED